VPAELHLLRPVWLLALIPLALLLWRLARRGEGAQAWRGLVDAHLLAHLIEGGDGRARRWPLVLLALGWVLLVLALAGPAWERLPQPVFQAEAQRVILLDISESMNAGDLTPSRLVRARFEVLDLLDHSREGQVALIAYGAEPFVVSPLTRDAATIAAQVPDLETNLLPVTGPARAELALELAGDLLERAGPRTGDMILVTDGVHDPQAAERAAARLRERGYRVSVLGVGTEKGAPIPRGDGGFLTDESGAILLPRLEREVLRALADAGGGRYLDARPDDVDTRALLPVLGAGAERSQEADTRADLWREEGPWLLLPLLLLGALAFRRGWLSPLVLVALIMPHPPALALGWDDLWLRPDQRAARAFAEGAYQEAAESFRRPDWRAAAEYESGDYAAALASLDGPSDVENGYNRGNALARLGRLEEAIAEYERVLAADPDHADARHNRDLLRRLLEQQSEENPQRQPESPSAEGQDQGQDQAQDGGGGAQPQAEDDGQAGQGADAKGEPGGEETEGSTRPDQGGEGSAESQPPEGEGDSQEAQDAEESSAEADPSAAASAELPGEEAAPEPGRDDLVGGAQDPGPALSPRPVDDGAVEQDQAIEQLLRRVPDDPGGLLRQRFLLQHLRRSGELP
jgi:Ca-activated chloride channel family protein